MLRPTKTAPHSYFRNCILFDELSILMASRFSEKLSFAFKKLQPSMKKHEEETAATLNLF